MIAKKYRFGGRHLPLLISLMISGASFAQKQNTENAVNHVSAKVTGKITSNGTPLEGATIAVKGSNTTTITDAAGYFSIAAPKNAILIVSYVGMENKEVKVEGSTVDVDLASLDKPMDEVVVIGFGTMKKRDLTGAIVSVKPEEITARPGPNPMESLQGRVAGLDITRSSGQAGAGVNIQLRGNRSITASGTPLFIINGLPGDYSTLNPYDIESIEVLKDASSTAVYGSAGSNGVILITTKGGKAGKLTVDVNSFYGYNGWSKVPASLTGDGYLKAKRDAFSYVWDATNSQWTKTGALWQSPANDKDIFGDIRYPAFLEGQYTDWVDLFLRKNPATQNYSIGVSGGTEKTKAYISANYTDENGQYRGDSYKQFSTNMRIDHKIKPWISIGANLQASYVIRRKAQDKLENVIVTDPLARPYRADGTINPDLGNNVYNLLLDYQPGVYDNLDNNTKLHFNPYVEIKPFKGFTILSRAGASLNYNNNYRFDGIGSVNYTYNNAGISRAEITQNRYVGYQWENILTYNLKVADDHDFTFTGVSTYYNHSNTNTFMRQSNIVSNTFKWYNMQNDPLNTVATSAYTMSKTYGLIGRVNYSYLGKYLFSASIRRDGSSVLYSKNRWDNFPALSAGWRISDENFMEGTQSWLSSLKVRVGWGVTGVSNIDPFSSIAVLESANMSLGGVAQPIYRNSQYLTNPDLGWEKSYNTNIGIDASLFKNRIDIALDVYNTATNGVIFGVTSPITNGTYRPGTQYLTNINIAETNNKGIELSINSRNIVSKNFEWTTSAAFAFNREKVLKLIGGAANNIARGDYFLTLGEPISSFRNYKIDGIWQIGEEADAAVFGRRPGDIKVNVPGITKLADGVYTKEVNGVQNYYYTNLTEALKYNPSLTAANSRYTYSNNDFQTLGHNSPDWSLGIQNTFKYKNFDLGIYTYARFGQMIRYSMIGWYQPSAFSINASPSRTFPAHFNYWTPENPSNDFPAMDNLMAPSTMPGFDGLAFVDGSFIKIKNITLGYTLPANIAKKASIQRLRFYATISNLLVVARHHLLKDYDPEMNGGLSYPLTKEGVIGLNVTF